MLVYLTIRTVMQTFRRLTSSIFMSFDAIADDALCYERSVSPATECNPSRSLLDEKMQYRIVVKDLASKTRQDEDIDTDHLDADVVVIGSGAGGGIMASELHKAGLNVLVLEKGGFYYKNDFSEWKEPEAMLNLYEKGGFLASEDGCIPILAGSCVGGGTTLNWGASFRTPDYVREEWTHQLNLPQFRLGGEFDEHLDAVHSLLNVNTNCSYRPQPDQGDGSQGSCKSTFQMNENNRLLWNAAEALGYIPEKIPRNVKDCVDCGHCNYGCSFQSKQSTSTAFIEPILLSSNDAASQSADHPNRQTAPFHLIYDCTVKKILTSKINPSKRIVTGVEATVIVRRGPKNLNNGISKGEVLETRKLIVSCPIVVVCAGSIHTPALLLRSGFKHKKIGKHLALHPVLGMVGIFPRKNTGLERGVSMGVVVRKDKNSDRIYSKNHADDEKYHPLAIQTPPMHLGTFGLVMPWFKDGLVFKYLSTYWRNMGVFIAIPRDRSCESNRVEIDSDGNPMVHYRVTKEDMPMLYEGHLISAKLQLAAGADYLMVSSEAYPIFVVDKSLSYEKNLEKLEAYLEVVHKDGLTPFKLTVLSAHQMGSCRMSASIEDGPTKANGELYECDNIFIADGSVLPTSLGINPMVTIEAVSRMISVNVIHKFSQLKGEMRKSVKKPPSKQW